MDEIVGWIWLQDILGVENPRFKNALDVFGNVRAIYAANLRELELSAVFTFKECMALQNKNLTDAEKILGACRAEGYRILSIQDEDYPSRLRTIDAPPIVLYMVGELPDLNGDNGIAIVGTRHPSAEGLKKTFELSYQLAKHDRIIVSGGALGIDTAAHKGALQANGQTVCVMGCGLRYNYMAENRPMRGIIARHGAVVSEYPPDHAPTRYTFPKRNRIIAGLSAGTIVMEAGMRSGALITARNAAKQGRCLMAFEDIERKVQSDGVSMLIREGARIVHGVDDVLNYVPTTAIAPQRMENARQHQEEMEKQRQQLQPRQLLMDNAMQKQTPSAAESITHEKQKSKEPRSLENEAVSEAAKKIYAVLAEGLTADECALKSGLPIARVLGALSELEIYGLAVCHAGSRYERL